VLTNLSHALQCNPGRVTPALGYLLLADPFVARLIHKSGPTFLRPYRSTLGAMARSHARYYGARLGCSVSSVRFALALRAARERQ
jgi:hypothetical protein